MVLYLAQASAADIDRMIGDPSGIEDLMFAEEGLTIDFDVAWHAVHHVLTGSDGATDSPLSILIDGTEALGQDANGFGGFWAISPDRMAAFATALDALSDDILRARYDVGAMADAEVYRADVLMEDEDQEGASDYVFQGLPALRKFAAQCAIDNAGALKMLA